jgi:hypothetical protein
MFAPKQLLVPEESTLLALWQAIICQLTKQAIPQKLGGVYAPDIDCAPSRTATDINSNCS